jgi:mannose/fructose/N-acetylgalactosamine-specific phosphotransferase system component IID
MFPLKEELDDFDKDKNTTNSFNRFNDQSREEKSSFVATQTLLPVLERLYQNFSQNHQKLENIQQSNGQFFEVRPFQS